jgi:branched-chain amino acid aminotransferase
VKCDAAFNFFFVNGALQSVGDATVFDRIEANSVYEVIKLIDGIPLFFEDHLDRMKRSAELLGSIIEKPAAEVRHEIETLVEKNTCTDINTKLVWYKRKNVPVFITYFVQQDFPTAGAYQKGVHTILYGGERRDPQIKALKTSFRERAMADRKAAGAYEALLVDENGYISEGTRSNLFFLVDRQLCTPPSDDVLLGVTRRQVLAICRERGIDVREQKLHKKDLGRLEAAFITGTTIDVLPVGSVDQLRFASVGHPVVHTIIGAFADRVAAYIANEKRSRK